MAAGQRRAKTMAAPNPLLAVCDMETYFVMSRNNIPKPLLSVIVVCDHNPLTTCPYAAIVTFAGVLR
jgi:hypothetical protein